MILSCLLMVFLQSLLKWVSSANILRIGDVHLNQFVWKLLERMNAGWSIFLKILAKLLKRLSLSDYLRNNNYS
jgi:hypothetical protein